MAETQHTPEPWTLNTLPVTPDIYHHTIGGYARDDKRAVIIATAYPVTTGYPITDDGQPGSESHANATRIVACVNACEGINPDAVPNLIRECKYMRSVASSMLNLKEEREGIPADLWEQFRQCYKGVRDFYNRALAPASGRGRNPADLCGEGK